MALRNEADGAGSLREQVLARVRTAIVSGRGAPGTTFSVPSLAAELGVSTTPVREALLELSRMGFLTPMRNRGFRVEPITLEDTRQLFEARVVLERHALEVIAARRLQDAAPLRALADAVGDAVGRGDIDGYVAADRAFHQALVARAGNPVMDDLIMGLRDRMRLYGIDTPKGHERQRASVAEHHRLLDLAEAGEVAAIGALLETHVNDWLPVFAEALDRAGPLGSRLDGTV